MIRTLLVMTASLGLLEPQDPVPEPKLKAVYLYTFGKATSATWPEGAFAKNPGSFVIGILGKDPFDGHLESTTKGKKLQKRPVKIETFGADDDVSGCHMLFVTKEHLGKLPALRKNLAGKPVLIMGDTPNFAKSGGAVEFFVTRKNRVHFRINPRAAERAGVKIDHKILRMVERTGNLVKEDEE